MKYFSTNNPKNFVPLNEAVIKSMPSDYGLYMPEYIPELPGNFIKALPDLSFEEIALTIAAAFFSEDVTASKLDKIVLGAINFDAPLVKISEQLNILELFHGPTLAFKDFGARFMSRLMSHLVEGSNKKLNILVATSGDTGSAVANGFYNVEGIDVTILYPSGKISDRQEKQIATFDKNITALEVDGTFDDCQRLVKEAFIDKDLNNKLNLSSANSINIARLIPQSFYYFRAYSQFFKDKGKSSDNQVIISVPCGNFGNLTAGLIAKKMGLPVQKFIAATNINDVVPEYFNTGEYKPRKSVPTVSNAMDVGAPSNMARIQYMYKNDLNLMKQDITAYSFNEAQTKENIKNIFKQYSHVLEPHGSVACLGLLKYLSETKSSDGGIFFGTAHPSKFSDIVEQETGIKVDTPERLSVLFDREKLSVPVSGDFADFKEYLLTK